MNGVSIFGGWAGMALAVTLSGYLISGYSHAGNDSRVLVGVASVVVP